MNKIRANQIDTVEFSQVSDAPPSLELIGKGALAYASATQSIANSGNIAFSNEIYDTNGIFESVTNPDRLTVPSGVQKIRITGQVTVSQTSGGTYRGIVLNKNGGSFGGASGNSQALSVLFDLVMPISSPILTVSAGDYFTIQYFEDGTGINNIVGGSANTWFAMELIA